MLDGGRNFVETVLLAVGALLPIVDPLGSAPIYLQMTAGADPAARVPMAKAVAVDSFLLLLASTLLGVYVLDFFGLSIPDIQVAGGLLVCALAWSLLSGPDAAEALPRSAAADTATDWKPRAFYPLTMPVTVGPGSISVAITLGAHHASQLGSWIVAVFAHALGILIIAVAVYLSYRYAGTILRKLGRTGVLVFVRLSAFILLSIGVHIAWAGIRGLLASR